MDLRVCPGFWLFVRPLFKKLVSLPRLCRVALSVCLLEPEVISQHYCPSRKRRFIAVNGMDTV